MANLLDKDFKTAVLKTLKELKEHVEKAKRCVNSMETSIKPTSENLNTNQKEILEVRSTVSEMRNSPVKFKGILEQTEERIREPEDGTMEIIKLEDQKEKRWKKSEQRLKNLRKYHQADKHTHCDSPTRRREKERERQNIEEIMTAISQI